MAYTNFTRRVSADKSPKRVVIPGRQPIIPQLATGLNATNEPKANVRHVSNPLQRKIG